jgi:hypothetical protein
MSRTFSLRPVPTTARLRRLSPSATIWPEIRHLDLYE